jgi:hypothetical protein
MTLCHQEERLVEAILTVTVSTTQENAISMLQMVVVYAVHVLAILTAHMLEHQKATLAECN